MIIVKRFKVRRNGIVYGPGQPGGQIITGLSKKEEARLIAGSESTIEKYSPFKVEKQEENTENRSENTGKPAENNENESEDDENPNENLNEKAVKNLVDTSTDNEEDLLNMNIDDLIRPGGK